MPPATGLLLPATCPVPKIPRAVLLRLPSLSLYPSVRRGYVACDVSNERDNEVNEPTTPAVEDSRAVGLRHQTSGCDGRLSSVDRSPPCDNLGTLCP